MMVQGHTPALLFSSQGRCWSLSPILHRTFCPDSAKSFFPAPSPVCNARTTSSCSPDYNSVEVASSHLPPVLSLTSATAAIEREKQALDFNKAVMTSPAVAPLTCPHLLLPQSDLYLTSELLPPTKISFRFYLTDHQEDKGPVPPTWGSYRYRHYLIFCVADIRQEV